MSLRKMAVASTLGLSMSLALLGSGVASAHVAGSPVAVANNTNIIRIIAGNEFERRGFGGCGCGGFDGFDGFNRFDGFDGFHRFGPFGFDGFC